MTCNPGTTGRNVEMRIEVPITAVCPHVDDSKGVGCAAPGDLMVSLPDHADRIRGRVKWFDPVKGFGFVVSDEGGPDILLHANVLRAFGQGSVADGARISLVASQTPRGQQALEITEILPPDDAAVNGAATARPQIFDPGLEGGPLVPARVKWFDRAKGFGFANVFGCAEDVFIHVEVLRRSSLADLQAGEAVALRIAAGQRGQLATEVGTWDTVMSAPQD